MHFECLTLFPKMFESPFQEGLVGQAISRNLIRLTARNLRDFSKPDVHKTMDDRPYGGGDGMVMLAGPIDEAIIKCRQESNSKKNRTLYLTPQGRPFSDKIAKELSEFDHLILICGRYGGVDERVISTKVDDEISLGDFILSGGEIAAMALIDAISRHIPGVLGNEASSLEESFSHGLLESPQFTRPRDFQGLPVPEVLLSGDHEKIRRWRYLVSILRTKQRRPDLLSRLGINSHELGEALELFKNMSALEKKACGLSEKS